MSISAPLLPTAPTTLVIMLGASAWPKSPGFQASEAFEHATQGFKDYLLDPQGFGLPTANLCDQFDAMASASDQLEMLSSFLEQRALTLKAANQAVRDVLVYFVGHGGFAGPSADFYLLPRRANASSLRASGISIDALAEVLRDKARQTRRYLFLDCCFAAAAFRSFQGGPDQTAITKTLDAFRVRATSSGFPRKGTVLLCSSDHKSPSLLLPDESCTMFSHALLDVLRNGDLHRPPKLSLRDIRELAEDRLAALPEKNAPRPDLHSPDQSEGDVADVPFFPNPSVERERVRLAEEERQHQAEKAEQARKMEEEKRRRLEEERTCKAEEAEQTSSMEEEKQRRVEEEQRRQAEQVEQAHLATQKRLPNIKEQPSLTLSQTFPPPTSPRDAMFLPSTVPGAEEEQPPQAVMRLSPFEPPKPLSTPSVASTSATVPHLLASLRRPKPPGSPFAVAVLILLTLILLGTGSLGIYGVATGHLLGTGSNGVSTPTLTGKTPQPNSSVLGRTWHIQNSGTSQWLHDVAWSDSLSLFVAVGGNFITSATPGSTILTSPDGKSWTPQKSGTSQNLFGVAWSSSRGLFVAAGSSGTILTSPDGRSWTPQKSGTKNDLFGIARLGSQFVVVGASGTILTSLDGSNWTSQKSSTLQYLYGITWSGIRFVAVGPKGTILTSLDGRSWTPQRSGTIQNLYGVSWSGTRFVAVGWSGIILTSLDGKSWTSQKSGTMQYLYGVTWSGILFVAVGWSGIILTSPDGKNWTPQKSGTMQNLYGVAWLGTLFVAVGWGGAILTSS